MSRSCGRLAAWLGLAVLASSLLCDAGTQHALAGDIVPFRHESPGAGFPAEPPPALDWPGESRQDRQASDVDSTSYNDGEWAGSLGGPEPVALDLAEVRPWGNGDGHEGRRAFGSESSGVRWDVNALVRGYFWNDQRIQWSGLEKTFGVEAILSPRVSRRLGEWEVGVESEFYLNQPYERNILLDTAERRSYLANYQTETLEISQLAVLVSRGDWTIKLGKMVTPFGRYHAPLYSNARTDAPFIRTESILWRETGALIRWKPGVFVTDVAVVNGGFDRDTNSSKGVVARIGLDGGWYEMGVSAKWQDGTGSEHQKMYRNHLGADARVVLGRWVFSGEAIYDEYGMRRDDYDPEAIFWGRSIYNRDLNRADAEPLTGVGYHGGVGYLGDCWGLHLNYGVFNPEPIGDPRHDRDHHRGLVKFDVGFLEHLRMYVAFLVEDGGYPAQAGRPRRGFALLTGLGWEL